MLNESFFRLNISNYCWIHSVLGAKAGKNYWSKDFSFWFSRFLRLSSFWYCQFDIGHRYCWSFLSAYEVSALHSTMLYVFMNIDDHNVLIEWAANEILRQWVGDMTTIQISNLFSKGNNFSQRARKFMYDIDLWFGRYLLAAVIWRDEVRDFHIFIINHKCYIFIGVGLSYVYAN